MERRKAAECVPLPYLQIPSRRGFTLIEIVIVITIIAMVMLLVVPRLPSSDEEHLKISARTLAATLRYLQERAATSRTTYTLNINPGTEQIVIREAGGGDGGEPSDPLLQKPVLKDGISVADVRIPRLGIMRDGQVKVTVGMGGIRDFVTIHLRTADGRFWTVMAFPAGGKVKAFEGYHEDPP